MNSIKVCCCVSAFWPFFTQFQQRFSYIFVHNVMRVRSTSRVLVPKYIHRKWARSILHRIICCDKSVNCSIFVKIYSPRGKLNFKFSCKNLHRRANCWLLAINALENPILREVSCNRDDDYSQFYRRLLYFDWDKNSSSVTTSVTRT